MSSTEPTPSIIRLLPHLHPSPYGKPSSTSLASTFHSASLSPLSLSHITKLPTTRIGELWLSDHPSGISHILPSNTPISDVVSASPSTYLTPAVSARFNDAKTLPFIFKLLSFDRPLPLQVHPKREVAAGLKKLQDATEDDLELTDANHKPEVAVGLRDGMEAFVGFRREEEVARILEDVVELKQAIGGVGVGKGGISVKDAFERILKLHEERVVDLGEKLVRRVEANGDRVFGELGVSGGLGKVYKKCWERSRKGDVGPLAAIGFLNHVKLAKGEGIAVPAGCIHAYIEGDCVECMAWSDNMIAHGLQDPKSDHPPKMLVDCLDYQYGTVESLRLRTEPFYKSKCGKTIIYKAPVHEFDILNVELEGGGTEVLGGLNGPADFLVTAGEITVKYGNQVEVFKEGQAFYLKPNTEVEISSEKGADVWGAFVEGQ